MADFANFTEDWSLQAIVGGSSSTIAAMDMVDAEQQYFSSGIWDMPQHDDDNLLFAFSELFGQSSKLVDDGLEALYKPFYPVSDSIPSISVHTLREVQEKIEPETVETIPDQSVAEYVPKYKRRKNQHKRVVIKVTAEDLSSDRWAWRKYGQKPIKGSPYPRSYYRCSSMKGCLARKQVEQSCSDPDMYIVTYTAEHCHSQPTRRNSLAGTVRNKFPTPTSTDHNANMSKKKDSYASSSTSLNTEIVSPKSSSLIEYSSEEAVSERIVKQENLNIGDDDEQTVELGCSNGFSMSDVIMNGDFFTGLGDLSGSILESAIANSSSGSLQNMTIYTKS